ncbi:unnamed protein product [Toxocara canis]|uniref:Histone H2A n=1 Tax=Toxocara canis TaxID=6265 RepID=A0A183V8V5_TOXCA|nr:unnamed protein product [Toxocara canis]
MAEYSDTVHDARKVRRSRVTKSEESGRLSRSFRAGLNFPVGRMHRLFRRHSRKRIAEDAAIQMTAVLEYLTTELLELAGEAARANGKRRICPRHLMLAVRCDDELDRLLGDVIFLQGGVVPHIEPHLLRKQNH